MAWIELHQNLLRHPKLIRLAAGLGVKKQFALWHLLSLWLWALDYADNGDLSAFGSPEIAVAAEWSGDPDVLLSALQKARWLDDLMLHDWMDYAGRLVENRAANKGRQKRFRDKTRIPIYNRDGGSCVYCGIIVDVDSFYVDHIIPIAKGGSNESHNLATSCNSCNIKKGGRTPEESGMPISFGPLRNALRTPATLPNQPDQPTDQTGPDAPDISKIARAAYDAYPDSAEKDGRPTGKGVLALGAVTEAVRRAPGFPWVEYAELIKEFVKTPKNIGTWAQTGADYPGLESLRKIKGAKENKTMQGVDPSWNKRLA
jgi:hypothetical protein